MTAYAFDWVDAFADAPFAGNGCAVVHDADGVPLGRRLALVRETSLTECAYVVASSRADFGARYYVDRGEIPLAGHPTVATVAALIARGQIALADGRADLSLEVGAGVMPIAVEEREGRPLVRMTQPAPEFGPHHEPAEIAALYGLGAEDVLGTPREVSTGTPYIVTVLASHEALRRARLDADALLAFRERHGHGRDALIEPFLVTLGGATEAGDTFSRLLLPPPQPAEDPFTGSATGCMAAHLWAEGLIETPRFRAEQGHWLGRPGWAEVEVLGPRDSIKGIRVAGTGVRVMQGTVEL